MKYIIKKLINFILVLIALISQSCNIQNQTNNKWFTTLTIVLIPENRKLQHDFHVRDEITRLILNEVVKDSIYQIRHSLLNNESNFYFEGKGTSPFKMWYNKKKFNDTLFVKIPHYKVIK